MNIKVLKTAGLVLSAAGVICTFVSDMCKEKAESIELDQMVDDKIEEKLANAKLEGL